MTEITLKASSTNINQRIDLLTLLHDRAVEKVNHSDTFRQRNMNYALAIFAALVAVGVRLDGWLSHAIVSGTLFSLMVIFCVWDRRWHKTKHGWDHSSYEFYKKLRDIINDPNQDVSYQLYYVEGEPKAEWFSLQPIVFYFLIAASVVSFFVFGSLKPTS